MSNDAISREAAVRAAQENVRMNGGSTGDAYGTSEAIVAALRSLPSIPAAPTTAAIHAAAREIVQKVSDAAIELAFTRHELTTTEYEAEEHAGVEEGVEAFKVLVEEIKADVLACLTGDEEGCLDPEDVDYDNELEWTIRRISRHLATDSATDRAELMREKCVAKVEEMRDSRPKKWKSEGRRHFDSSGLETQTCEEIITALKAIELKGVGENGV